MTSGSNHDWHSDPEQLVSVLCDTLPDWGNVPEIQGYDEMVELERGGQGVVYRAQQRSMNRTVAIKVLSGGRLASEASRCRFQREIEFSARLRHPHIVSIFDSGVTSEGFPYYVMEYIDGHPLASNPENPLELFGKICDAVQHAHQHGIIHRDLKPENILIDADSSPHILDFGIAKTALWDDVKTPVSSTGQFLGSLPWVSPEQIEKPPDEIDIRTDVYSLGVILYQMLTGRLPHEVSHNLRQMLEGIVRTPPPRPRTLCPKLSDDVETIVLKCLAKERKRRYQTVGEVSSDIRRFLSRQPIDAKRDRTWYVFRKLVSRHKAVFGLISVMVVVILGFACTMAVLFQRASDSEVAAQRNLEKTASVQAFLQDMLNLSDPCRSPETSHAVRVMLDKAALSIGDRFRSNPDIEAEVRHMLGSVYWNLSRLDEAQAQEETALNLMESVYGENHPDLAKILLCLGHIKISLRHLGEAENLLQRAREILSGDRNRDHVLVARCWLHLAELRRVQFRIREANELFQKAHSIYAEHPGDDNMFMLKTLIKWSNMLLTEQERHGRMVGLDEVLKKLDEALAILEAYPGDNLWAGCLVKLHLGRASLAYGEYESAENFFEEAERCGKAVYGCTHSLVGDIANLKGRVFHYQDRFNEAEEWYRQAIAIHDESGEERTPSRAWCYWNLAQSRLARKDHEGAEESLRDAITVIMRAPENDHFLLPSYLNRLGRLLGEQGRWSDAKPLFEKALRLQEEFGEGAYVPILRAKALLGECLAELGRFEEGESLLLEVYESLTRYCDVPDDYVRHTRFSLRELYTAWGKPEHAEEFGK